MSHSDLVLTHSASANCDVGVLSRVKRERERERERERVGLKQSIIQRPYGITFLHSPEPISSAGSQLRSGLFFNLFFR